eukprot:contig_2138_g383
MVVSGWGRCVWHFSFQTASEYGVASDTMSVVDALGDVLQPDGVAQSSLVTLADMERQERLIIGQMQELRRKLDDARIRSGVKRSRRPKRRGAALSSDGLSAEIATHDLLSPVNVAVPGERIAAITAAAAAVTAVAVAGVVAAATAVVAAVTTAAAMVAMAFEAVTEVYEEGDLVWVHNYHLLLLPAMLRRRLWYAKIGFFLYTPFPSSEIFRLLPQRSQVLRGILGADLAGFHTYDYSKQFLASCARLLGLEGSPKGIQVEPGGGHVCEIGIYPPGIDVAGLKAHVVSKAVRARVLELRDRFAGRAVVVSVERLDDAFAGIPLTLLAFESLLHKHPEYVTSVVLVLVATIPRHPRQLSSYRALASQINTSVGRINSTYGSIGTSPVHFINAELPQDELYALMSVGSVCVVSSIRDGMSLVPYEWAICQHAGNRGPLILSEFAAAAHSFSTARHVNPWDVDDLRDKLAACLTMPAMDKRSRDEAAYRFVTTHTAQLWGLNFLEDLEEIEPVRARMVATPHLDEAALSDSLRSSTKRKLFVLDYDGTLIPFHPLWQLAAP